MSLIPVIPPYIAPYKPMNNITPFTYQDGATFLDKLEDISGYLSHDIVDFVNENFVTLGNEFETQANLIIATVNTQLDAAIDEVVSNSATVQDATIAAAVNNGASLTRDALDALYDPANVADASVAGVIEDAGSLTRARLNAHFVALSNAASIVYGTDGAGAQTALSAVSAATASTLIKRDAAGRAQVVSPSAATDISNKTYTDTTAASAAAAATTGAALDTVIAGLVASGTTTHPALIALADAEANAISAAGIAALLSGGNVFKRYSTMAGLPVTGQALGVLAVVDSIPGAVFVYTSATTYVMTGIARFADATARDAAITTPALGMRAFIADWALTTEYATLVTSSSTNIGRAAAGWYPIINNIQRLFTANLTGTTAVSSPVTSLIIKRKPYTQRVLIRYNGYIAGTTTGGMSLSASAGGTATGSGFAAIAVTGAASAYAPSGYVDIAAGTGTDVTITLTALGGGTITLAGMISYEIYGQGEY